MQKISTTSDITGEWIEKSIIVFYWINTIFGLNLTAIMNKTSIYMKNKDLDAKVWEAPSINDLEISETRGGSYMSYAESIYSYPDTPPLS